MYSATDSKVFASIELLRSGWSRALISDCYPRRGAVSIWGAKTGTQNGVPVEGKIRPDYRSVQSRCIVCIWWPLGRPARSR